ncbi:septal ring lytic transglycosylase RlpA family protein [Caulobacter vibrioides]|nr:septal ring lytic transglycosylase RlpA family protein [Caulobacter vibrioides]YP_002517274.1 RipA-family peptidoglycan hydrolase [Caulobacter vibrioides NA1000]ACL95366.1 RipA-family peptidoglycan hydrolase [Caulobacter vibrioides NA1000]ATC28700.1 septal ring lytic transglycosylase RlpA family protein [Caulobacter vibrioides]QXZ53879.1 septal ring lytic transglycosylase RlpA family protein [Caulobacter vibrioides]
MNQRIEQAWRIARNLGLMALAAASLAACATPKYEFGRTVATSTGSAPRPGSMIGRDGKPLRGTEKPYQIKGIWYYPHEDRNYNVVGIGSWYGEQFHNRKTSNGEIFDMNLPSAAHKTLPLPSLVEVTNLDNGRKMILRVNDRGPFVGDRIIDLSKAAADELGYRRQGVARVRVKYVGPAPRRALEAPRQYAQAAPTPPPPPRPRTAPRSFEDIQEPPQRVQVLPPRREATWSPAPIQQSAPPINPPDPVFTSSRSAYRVQAGSFSTRENAEKAVRQLTSAGRASIEAVERATGTLYRVTVAAGEDESAAWTLRERVEALGYSGATILRP